MEGPMSSAVKWTVFLLIILNLTHFYQAKDFWTLHVDYPKTKASGKPPEYCNNIMRQRGLINNTYLRPFHTFIHESNSTILNICANSTNPHYASFAPNSYESQNPLHLTECCIKTCSPNFVCTYKEVIRMSKIRLACLNGHPDHLITYINYSPTKILINLLFGGPRR
ncbi:angiogenin [Monodelphis domestica]|uniref:angiogenin n=1 Tax=Monodelphis domestica TaxID=13616 RepID=UPI0024E1B3F5|nr:angiogenin [Monodelphis domestica]